MSYPTCEHDACCLLEEELDPEEAAEPRAGLCPPCSPSASRGSVAEPAAPVGCDRYPVFFQRVARRARGEEERADRDRAASDALYRELMRIPTAERARIVDHHGRYLSFALAERLLAASREADPGGPDAAQGLARLALGIAERLDAARYGAGLVADLKARAWAYLGDAWSDSAPEAAREAFRLARSLLSRGSGDPCEEAEVLSLAARAAPGAGDDATAIAELERAEAFCRSTGDLRRLVDALLRRARLVARCNGPSEAARVLREAAHVREVAADTELSAELGTELALHLEAAGRPNEAWIELGRVRRLSGGGVPRELALRLRWIEGRVAARLGLDDEARRHLEAARDGFLAAGRPREAVAALLDLVDLAAREEGTRYEQAMDGIGRQLHHLALAGRLPREHTTALTLLGQAAERRALRPDLVRSVAGFLARVR